MCCKNDSETIKINHKLCANSAEVFFNQGSALLCQKTQTPIKFLSHYAAPCTAELAFSCELYLKAIIAAEKESVIIKGHHINTLYKQLSMKRKEHIKIRYNNLIADHPEIKSLIDLEQCLKTHNNAFVEWRYHFEEGKQLSVEWTSLFFLALALKDEYIEITNPSDNRTEKEKGAV